MRQAKSNMEVYGICGWDKGCEGCTYGVVAAIAVSGMNTLAVVVGIRVMQYTIVNYLKKD
jgi:hypothetical protein